MNKDSLKGGIWNIRYGRNKRRVKRKVKRILRRYDLDFLMLQEAADYTKQLKHIPGYHLTAHKSDKRSDRNTPVLVRSSLDHTHGRVVDMNGDGWRFKSGQWRPAKSAGTVLLCGWLRLFSIHAPVSVWWDGAGRMSGPSERVDDYGSYIRTMKRKNRWNRRNRPGQAMLFGGDWNARTFERGTGSPYWLARTTDLEIAEPAERKGPGHNGIDYVMTRGATVSKMRKRRRFGSDHPLVTFWVSRG